MTDHHAWAVSWPGDAVRVFGWLQSGQKEFGLVQNFVRSTDGGERMTIEEYGELEGALQSDCGANIIPNPKIVGSGRQTCDSWGASWTDTREGRKTTG